MSSVRHRIRTTVRAASAPTALRRASTAASLGWALGAFLLCIACASSGGGRSGATGVRGMVVLQNFETGNELRIVSDSWVAAQGYTGDTVEERRVEFYSTKDRTLQAKICEDQVFDGVVEALRQSGFEEHAARGPSPIGGGGARNAIDLAVNDDVRHLSFRRGDSDERARAFSVSVQIVGDVYNAIPAYQAMSGRVDFERGSTRGR